MSDEDKKKLEEIMKTFRSYFEDSSTSKAIYTKNDLFVDLQKHLRKFDEQPPITDVDRVLKIVNDHSNQDCYLCLFKYEEKVGHSLYFMPIAASSISEAEKFIKCFRRVSERRFRYDR